MVRNVVGSVLALIGATAAVWSPFRDWYGGRPGRDFRIDELFSGGGVTEAKAELFASLFLPFAFAALLTLAGLVLRSRLLVALAGVVVLGFTVLWMVRQGQSQGSLTVAGDGSGLNQGLLGSLGGGALLLLAAAVMRGRARRGSRGRSRREPAVVEPDPGAHQYQDQYQDSRRYEPYETPEPYAAPEPYGTPEPTDPYGTPEPHPYQDPPTPPPPQDPRQAPPR
ncbi:hypothetical protein ACFVYR_18755 [Streptomyces sp. NPDC058284]|uniref:hypothetical protein n=1 Tax=unclassified Streptomyces TaxID=2593676 RepID=UPI00365C64FF